MDEQKIERNLHSIVSTYQHDRRRFMLQKKQAESWIREVLNLSDEWFIELSKDRVKFTCYEGHSLSDRHRICKYLEDCVVNVSVETDFISKAVEITMKLKRMEEED